jgi:hypothetical protein
VASAPIYILLMLVHLNMPSALLSVETRLSICSVNKGGGKLLVLTIPSLQSSAKYILVTGSLQECLRGCGV